jgi:ABC-2 type transport system permease protein
MSTSSPPLDGVQEASAGSAPAPARGSGGGSLTRPTVGRFLRSELALVFRRRRNLVLLAVLALIPVLIGVAIRLSSSSPNPGEGPQFIDRIAGNGLFLSLTALVAVLPLFLPLAVSVISGDSVAGEANLGTLRSLLVVPVRRGRLLAVKYAAVVAFCFAAVLVVAVAGALTGFALFPVGPVTLLSGSTIPLAEAIFRALLIALYVGVSMAGLAAIGLFVSTLTEVPVGAMAATLTLSIVSQVLDAIPQVSGIHPYLFSHRWMAFGDLLRQPVAAGDLLLGIGTQAAYMAVFLILAWSRFGTSDVSS